MNSQFQSKISFYGRTSMSHSFLELYSFSSKENAKISGSDFETRRQPRIFFLRSLAFSSPNLHTSADMESFIGMPFSFLNRNQDEQFCSANKSLVYSLSRLLLPSDCICCCDVTFASVLEDQIAAPIIFRRKRQTYSILNKQAIDESIVDAYCRNA